VTARTVEAAGAALAVEERGEGTPALLMHGPALDRRGWDGVVAELGGDVHTVAYDRRAYGDSTTFEVLRGTTVAEQAEDAATVIRALELGPVVVCGHEVGALIALDLLLRHPELVTSAVLIEPALLSLVPAGREAVAAIRDVVENGVRDGGPAGAVLAYLEHVGGPRALELVGPDRLERAGRGARPFAADLAAGPAWRYTPRELRRTDVEVVVMAGTRSDPVRREAAAVLAETLPEGRLVQAEAGHFVGLEAPEAVAEVLRGLP